MRAMVGPRAEFEGVAFVLMRFDLGLAVSALWNLTFAFPTKRILKKRK
jgi:hypothetical protein